VISPDANGFEAFLGRGWCQLELLSAFCPVLSKTEEVSNGNFYMQYEDTRIDSFYTCAANDRALILGSGSEQSLNLSMVRNPKHLNFSVPEDAIRIQAVLSTITAAFKDGLPRKERLPDGQGQLSASRSVTNTVKFDEASKTEIEGILQLLST
jgi:hypothetical protein